MAKHPALDDVWKDDDRRLELKRREGQLDRRLGKERRSGLGFRPEPNRRQFPDRRKAVNE